MFDLYYNSQKQNLADYINFVKYLSESLLGILIKKQEAKKATGFLRLQ